MNASDMAVYGDIFSDAKDSGTGIKYI